MNKLQVFDANFCFVLCILNSRLRILNAKNAMFMNLHEVFVERFVKFFIIFDRSFLRSFNEVCNRKFPLVLFNEALN
jgi:hypothetical protein